MPNPSFSDAQAASQRIYNPANPAEQVAQVVGGKVADNIRDAKYPWKNTCAVRMSYILNQSGITIPPVAGQTVYGADQRNYFYRVKDVITFLKQRLGKPEVVEYPASDGGSLAGRKGLVLFEVSGWSDANGHATLYDGKTCYDHCYFNEPGAKYRTQKANFWALE